LTALDDDLLCFQSSGIDLPLLLRESLGSCFSVGLCAFDCVLERLLTGLDRGRDFRKNETPKDEEEEKEDEVPFILPFKAVPFP